MTKSGEIALKNILNLMFKKLPFLFLLLNLSELQAQSCVPTAFQLTPTAQNKTIEWQKFPDFTLPFSIIYGGPRFGDSQRLPLKHGFSHLATFENADANLPKQQRAAVWYGVGYINANQPWETLRSPWNNNLDLYRGKWQSDLRNMPEVDLLVPDIELQIKSNDSILLLKNHPLTPAAYKTFDNNAFVIQYKKDLQALYAEAFGVTKATKSARIGGYADAPILNTYINIAGNSWQKWTSDASLLNYLHYDFSKNALGSEVFNRQDFFSPSAYYYYDYPNPLAPDYLAYLLFQIEVNKAWAGGKPIIPFVWLRYSYTTAIAKKFIKPFMAEATAIFPFFSGANGLWLWDDPTTFANDENYATYEHFVNGLYRLSIYKDMFTGNYELVIPTPAREYVDTRKPIWRGVAKDNNFLVAAHNPYAKSETEEVIVEVTHKNWKLNVSLKGYEVFLCKFDMNLLATEPQTTINSFDIFPNPSPEQVSLKINSLKNQDIMVDIVDTQGKTVRQEKVSLLTGENIKTLNIHPFSTGVYFIRALNFTKKLIKE